MPLLTLEYSNRMKIEKSTWAFTGFAPQSWLSFSTHLQIHRKHQIQN
jgi:hypothetical protein